MVGCALTSEDTRNRTTTHEASIDLGLMGVDYPNSLDPVDLGNPGDEWGEDDNNTIDPVVTGGAAYLGIPENDGGGDRMNTRRTGSMDFLNTTSTITYDIDTPSTGSRYSNGWCDIELGDGINNLRYSSSASATSSTWDSILTSITASICLGETNPSEPSTRVDPTTIVPPNMMVDIRAWLTARLFNNDNWGFTALFFETLKNRIFSCCMLRGEIPPITIESEPVPEFVIYMDQTASHEPALPITPIYLATPATPSTIQNTDPTIVKRAPTNKYTTTPPNARRIPRQTPTPKSHFTPETTKHRSPRSPDSFQDYVFPFDKTLTSSTPLPRHPIFTEPFETVWCTAEESHYTALCTLNGIIPSTEINSTIQSDYSSPDTAVRCSTDNPPQNPHSSDSALYTTLPGPNGLARNSALYSIPSVITNPPPSTEHTDPETQSSAGITGFTHSETLKIQQILEVPTPRGTTAITNETTTTYSPATIQPNPPTEIHMSYTPQNKLFTIQEDEEDEDNLENQKTQNTINPTNEDLNPTQDSNSEDSDSDGERFIHEFRKPSGIRSEYMIRRLEELCVFFDTVGSTHDNAPFVANASSTGVLASETRLCESRGVADLGESGRVVGTECYRQSWLGGCITPPLPVEIAVDEKVAEWCESDYYENFL